MAGGGGDGSRELDQTPTWAVALVCAVIVLISILLEKVLHKVGQVIFIYVTIFYFFFEKNVVVLGDVERRGANLN